MLIHCLQSLDKNGPRLKTDAQQQKETLATPRLTSQTCFFWIPDLLASLQSFNMAIEEGSHTLADGHKLYTKTFKVDYLCGKIGL